MSRCLALAKKGGHHTKSNPMVGAVLVYNDKIIGEGYHEIYGGPHAEVNCINSVAPENTKFITESTLYVSLEPCNHHGKTPPCTDLILQHKIPKVVIACTDPFENKNGKGIEKLQSAGVEVLAGIMEDEGKDVLRSFNTNLKGRPFIKIKFAQSKDLYIGQKDNQVWLSNEYSKVFSHKLRATSDAIIIGTNTAIIDNPSLTAREYPGENPIRIVIDKENKIPATHSLLADEHHTIIFTKSVRNLPDNKQQLVVSDKEDYVDSILEFCMKEKLFTILIEGGSGLINSFLKRGLWDEAYVIQTNLQLENGVKAPRIEGKMINSIKLGNDKIIEIHNQNPSFC
jgi:diaminohydroxyphosphoribosylaminopyrimidine deaminase/5-amino-6-(5-phosphoribosylamino)uracil reductase